MNALISANADAFLSKLESLRSYEELRKYQRYFRFEAEMQSKDDYFIGVRMGLVFALAKEFIGMRPAEIEKLLESPVHEARAGAVSIMDFQARAKKTTDERKKELFDLYLRRHDRINNWDLVDRSAPYVVGGYLFDRPRDVLYRLARSENIWERRTAIVATGYFIRKGEIADSFGIAEILLDDREDLIHKAVGWMLREAGRKNRDGMLNFLEKHAATMPRVMLRYAIEHLDNKERERFMKMKKSG